MKKPTTLHAPGLNAGGTTAYQVTGYLGKNSSSGGSGHASNRPDEDNDAELDPTLSYLPYFTRLQRYVKGG